MYRHAVIYFHKDNKIRDGTIHLHLHDNSILMMSLFGKIISVSTQHIKMQNQYYDAC